ncbi:hypothetical protein [Paenibacillus sp. NEAU-GSW1]|uniref:hypothetical protein n=1 Tax=Paenibacillus sp. NEAU-GSW1 TaxID=2682486 RepID=UPI0012E282F6|nr:hypothetical protein [Paenibacillus sp. NEAU-GSW1]MUT68120.1 hypothetical protein [Paenibacillus sp. NEAU-GSW1]
MIRHLFRFIVLLSSILSSTTFDEPSFTIETIPASKGNWTYIPEGKGEMIIRITTTNADRVKVWRVPTGTQQWSERKLICDHSGLKNNWACVWSYNEKESIHDHFVVIAYNKGSELYQSIISVTRSHSVHHQ